MQTQFTTTAQSAVPLVTHVQSRALQLPTGAKTWSPWWQRLNQSAGKTIRIASICMAAYWLLLFAGTHLPSASLPVLRMSDKLLHMGAFAGLAFLVAWAIPTRPGGHLTRAGVTFLIAGGYGCVDELTQKFIPGRHCCPYDLAADVVGAACGVVLYLAVRKTLWCFDAGRRLILMMSR
ncbi:MAG: VanZ family protein [Pirellulaceae bacterium]|nr:VanZ family protein [Pirellulaceae bacterium]